MKTARRTRRGYTVTEVLMALAVLTIGASGVIALQKATLISNTHARNLATANSIAQQWMERMRLDALAWNEPGKVPDLADTKWLNDNTLSVWAPPPTSPMGVTQPSGAANADVMGADLYNGDTSAVGFCTQVRLTRLSTQTAANMQKYRRMIRVEVRTYWDKTGQPVDCAAALPTDWHAGRFGFVYLVSAVLENNAPQ
jgi:type IV pilus assembly protein PilV